MNKWMETQNNKNKELTFNQIIGHKNNNLI